MSNLGLISLLSNKELEQLVQTRPDVKTGDRLEGKIVKKNDDGKVLIDFGKFKANVELKIPVEKGDIIRLVVVEKGKQLKLRLENPEVKVNENGAPNIKLPDPGSGKTIEELFSRIDSLLQKKAAAEGSQKPEAVLKDIKQELAKLQQHVESSRQRSPRESLPGDVRRDVEKLLENVEQKLGRLPDTPESAEKLQEVSKEIHRLRETLESAQQPRQSRDKPSAAEMDTAVKNAEKAVNRAAQPVQTASPVNPSEAGQPVDAVKPLEAAKPYQHMAAPKESVSGAETPSPETPELPELPEIKDRLIKQVEQVKELVQKSGVTDNNTVNAALEKLTRAVAEIDAVNSTEQLPHIQRLVKEEINPRLIEIKENINAEAAKLPSGHENRQALEAASRQIEKVQRDITVTLRQIEPPVSRIPSADYPPVEQPATDRLTQQALDRVAQNAKELLPAVKIAVKEALELDQVVNAGQTREYIPPETREQLQVFLKDLNVRLDSIAGTPENPPAPEPVETLARAVRNLDTAVSANRDYVELRDRIVKQVELLKELAEEYADHPAKKEIDAAIQKLAETADKISAIKNPDQLIELKRIVAEEFKPRLQELNRILEREFAVKTGTEAPANDKTADTAANRQVAREMQQHVQLLQNEIDITLEKNPVPPRALDSMIRIAERSLNKITTADIPTPPQTAEPVPRDKPPVQAFETSRVPLDQLKSDLQEVNDAARETVQLEKLAESSGTQEILTPQTRDQIDRLVSRMTVRLQAVAMESTAPGSRNMAPESQAANAGSQTVSSGVEAENVPDLSPRLEAMTRAVRNLRTTVEVNRDFAELRDRIVKQIDQLKERVQKHPELSDNKEIDAAIEKLSRAAEKISNLKSPDQLTELKQIITREIRPRISQFKETIKPENLPAPVSPETREVLDDMNKQVEQLARDIDLTLTRNPAPARAVDALVRIAGRAVDRVPLPPDFQPPAAPQSDTSSVTQPSATETPPSPDAQPVRSDIAAPPPESGMQEISKDEPPVREALPDPARAAQFREAAEQIGRDAAKLEQAVQKRPSAQHLPPETREQLETLLQNIGDRLNRLPATPSQTAEPVNVSHQLESLARAVRNLSTSATANRDLFQLRDDIVKQVAELKALVEKSDLPFKKELQAAIEKLSRSVENLEQIKNPEQVNQLREIINSEIKPALQELSETVTREIPKLPPSGQERQIAQDIADRAGTLTRQVGHQGSRPPVEPRELEALIKIADKTLRQLPQTPEIPKETVPSSADRTSTPAVPAADAPAVEIPAPATPRPDSAVDLAREQISRDVAYIREIVRNAEPRQTLPPQLQQEAEALLDQVAQQLEPLERTSSIQPSLQLEPLYRSINQLRTTLDVNRQFLETREQILKVVQQLETASKNADPPLNKELQTAINRLVEAAQKIDQLKSPEQLQELKQVLNEQVKPRLADVQREIAVQESATPPDSRRAELLNDLTRQVQNARQSLETAVSQQPAPPREIDALMKSVENALTRVAEAPPQQTAESAQAGQPQFSESIQDLYENIKAALKLLQSRLQISGDKLEMPTDIKNIFHNLQSDLHTSGASEQVLEQLPQIRELVEQTGLQFEKVNAQVLKTLDEIFQQIGQLREQHQFSEIRTIMQDRLVPHLKTMMEVFSDPFILSKSENPAVASKVMNAVDTLKTAIETAMAKAGDNTALGELSELSQLTEKLADLSGHLKSGNGTQNLKTSENIANLAHNIEELLSQLPEKAGESGNGAALVSRVKSLLSALHTHAEPLDIGDSALKLAPKLKSLVQDSGVFFEKKLHDILDQLSKVSERLQGIERLEQLPEIRSIVENDLKPNLLQLKEFLNDQRIMSQLGKSPALDSIKEAVEEMINNINSQQDRAVEQQPNQPPVQAFSFQIPIKGEEFGELKVFYNRGRDKDSPEEFKLSLLLEFDKIGEIRSDFFNIKKDLTISFYVRDANVKDFMDDNADELQKALEPIFENVGIQIVVSREKAAAFEPEQSETEIISDSAVNVKV